MPYRMVFLTDFYFLCVISGFVAAPVCAAPCPPGWTQFGSRCFIFYYESRTWVDAEKFCISIGGNLASIHSSEENTFLSTMVERVTGRTRFTWVGGYDAVNDSTWLWSDGSEGPGISSCLRVRGGVHPGQVARATQRQPTIHT
uniref:C-type lectin domain-containing protein n=1 Tax=Cyprinodon variegatus TaxID=28743 RepID=A0A3Q2EIN2_CYPVA